MGNSVSSNKSMVDQMVDHTLRTARVEGAFRAVDRAMYYKRNTDAAAATVDPYADQPWRNGQLHISAPCIYAKVVEALKLEPGQSFLNLGSGTGYLSTIVGLLIGPNGVNHGVELHAEVIEYAQKRLAKFMSTSSAIDKYDFAEPIFVQGNCVNLNPHLQYDRVYLGAACLPDQADFMKRLIKPDGGILVMPYEEDLIRFVRVGEHLWEQEKLFRVNFTEMVAQHYEDDKSIIEMPLPSARSLKDLCRTTIRQQLRLKTDLLHPNLLNSDNVDRRRYRRTMASLAMRRVEERRQQARLQAHANMSQQQSQDYSHRHHHHHHHQLNSATRACSLLRKPMQACGPHCARLQRRPRPVLATTTTTSNHELKRGSSRSRPETATAPAAATSESQTQRMMTRLAMRQTRQVVAVAGTSSGSLVGGTSGSSRAGGASDLDALTEDGDDDDNDCDEEDEDVEEDDNNSELAYFPDHREQRKPIASGPPPRNTTSRRSAAATAAEQSLLKTLRGGSSSRGQAHLARASLVAGDEDSGEPSIRPHLAWPLGSSKATQNFHNGLPIGSLSHSGVARQCPLARVVQGRQVPPPQLPPPPQPSGSHQHHDHRTAGATHRDNCRTDPTGASHQDRRHDFGHEGQSSTPILSSFSENGDDDEDDDDDESDGLDDLFVSAMRAGSCEHPEARLHLSNHWADALMALAQSEASAAEREAAANNQQGSRSPSLSPSSDSSSSSSSATSSSSSSSSSSSFHSSCLSSQSTSSSSSSAACSDSDDVVFSGTTRQAQAERRAQGSATVPTSPARDEPVASRLRSKRPHLETARHSQLDQQEASTSGGGGGGGSGSSSSFHSAVSSTSQQTAGGSPASVGRHQQPQAKQTASRRRAKSARCCRQHHHCGCRARKFCWLGPAAAAAATAQQRPLAGQKPPGGRHIGATRSLQPFAGPPASRPQATNLSISRRILLATGFNLSRNGAASLSFGRLAGGGGGPSAASQQLRRQASGRCPTSSSAASHSRAPPVFHHRSVATEPGDGGGGGGGAHTTPHWFRPSSWCSLSDWRGYVAALRPPDQGQPAARQSSQQRAATLAAGSNSSGASCSSAIGCKRKRRSSESSADWDSPAECQSAAAAAAWPSLEVPKRCDRCRARTRPAPAASSNQAGAHNRSRTCHHLDEPSNHATPSSSRAARRVIMLAGDDHQDDHQDAHNERHNGLSSDALTPAAAAAVNINAGHAIDDIEIDLGASSSAPSSSLDELGEPHPRLRVTSGRGPATTGGGYATNSCTDSIKSPGGTRSSGASNNDAANSATRSTPQAGETSTSVAGARFVQPPGAPTPALSQPERRCHRHRHHHHCHHHHHHHQHHHPCRHRAHRHQDCHHRCQRHRQQAASAVAHSSASGPAVPRRIAATTASHRCSRHAAAAANHLAAPDSGRSPNHRQPNERPGDFQVVSRQPQQYHQSHQHHHSHGHRSIVSRSKRAASGEHSAAATAAAPAEQQRLASSNARRPNGCGRRRGTECEKYRNHISGYIRQLDLPQVLLDYLNYGRDFD